MLTSTRRGIVYPNTNRSDSADVPRDIAAVVAALEIDVIYGQGTLAARPPSSAGTPGIAGRLYYATDNGIVYYDFGTGWVGLNSASGPTGAAGGDLTGTYPNPTIAALAVTGAKIAAATIDGSTKLIDASVTAAKLAAALFPSQGAGAGTEALRAIGSGASNVVAGNDARLTDTRTPVTGKDPSAYGTVLPTTGLFNGYTFRLFVSDAVAGSLVYDCVYRADLDGTRPWHVAACPLIQYGATSVHTTAAFNSVATAITFTAPRNGVYGYGTAVSFTSNGSGPVYRLTIAGSVGGWISTVVGGRATLTAGQTIVMEHSNDYSNVSLSDTSLYAVLTTYPQKVI